MQQAKASHNPNQQDLLLPMAARHDGRTERVELGIFLQPVARSHLAYRGISDAPKIAMAKNGVNNDPDKSQGKNDHNHDINQDHYLH